MRTKHRDIAAEQVKKILACKSDDERLSCYGKALADPDCTEDTLIALQCAMDIHYHGGVAEALNDLANIAVDSPLIYAINALQLEKLALAYTHATKNNKNNKNNIMSFEAVCLLLETLNIRCSKPTPLLYNLSDKVQHFIHAISDQLAYYRFKIHEEKLTCVDLRSIPPKEKTFSETLHPALKNILATVFSIELPLPFLAVNSESLDKKILYNFHEGILLNNADAAAIQNRHLLSAVLKTNDTETPITPALKKMCLNFFLEHGHTSITLKGFILDIPYLKQRLAALDEQDQALWFKEDATSLIESLMGSKTDFEQWNVIADNSQIAQLKHFRKNSYSIFLILYLKCSRPKYEPTELDWQQLIQAFEHLPTQSKLDKLRKLESGLYLAHLIHSYALKDPAIETLKESNEPRIKRPERLLPEKEPQKCSSESSKPQPSLSEKNLTEIIEASLTSTQTVDVQSIDSLSASPPEEPLEYSERNLHTEYKLCDLLVTLVRGKEVKPEGLCIYALNSVNRLCLHTSETDLKELTNELMRMLQLSMVPKWDGAKRADFTAISFSIDEGSKTYQQLKKMNEQCSKKRKRSKSDDPSHDQKRSKRAGKATTFTPVLDQIKTLETKNHMTEPMEVQSTSTTTKNTNKNTL